AREADREPHHGRDPEPGREVPPLRPPARSRARELRRRWRRLPGPAARALKGRHPMRVRPFAVPPPRAIATWARRRPFEGDVRALLHHDRDDVALPLAAFGSARRAVLAFRVYPETLLRARVG